MDAYHHYFTEEEANALLPELLPLIEAMLSARDELLALQPELQATLELAVNNGNSRVSGEALGAMQSLKDILSSLQAFGVEVKDVNRGLLDFPSKRAGMVVYLCWAYGEEKIAFWHSLDSGFAGRKPLDK